MRLNPLAAALAVAASVAVLAAFQAAEANFGDAQGFSGRSGATCIACHTVAPVLHEPATAHLDGLPDAWTPGETHTLTLRVTGGPDAMPAPQPQGGFDIAADGGRFTLPAGSETTLRLIDDLEVAYLPDGTLMRAWTVQWTAPDLSTQPRPVQLWLAVLAANGNHVVAAGQPDGGERFDSAADLTVVVPPSDAAWAAWRALPLALPMLAAVKDGDAWAVEGEHRDGNATGLGWRLDGGPWQSRSTGRGWQLVFQGLEPGRHTVEVRSEGAQRLSPPLAVTLDVQGVLGPLAPRDAPAPGPAVLLPVAFALAAVLRRSQQ